MCLDVNNPCNDNNCDDKSQGAAEHCDPGATLL